VENPSGLKLRTVDCSEEVLPNSSSAKPCHVFEVKDGKQSQRWQVFLSQRGPDCKLHSGYHGSRTENFFSILTYGLQQHLNKTSLFGHGIYLSTELSMALGYSGGSGNAYAKSALGARLAAVVQCEVIDDQEVKLHSEGTLVVCHMCSRKYET